MSDRLLNQFTRACIEPLLVEYNFTRENRSFFISKDSGTGLLEFQKSRSAEPGHLLITVTLGFISKELEKHFSIADTERGVATSCHWYTRIGRTLPAGADVWWTINEPSLMPNDLTVALLDYAIPTIDRVSSRDGLIEQYMGDSRLPGVGEMERFLYLTTLLHQRKDPRLTFFCREAQKEAAKMGGHRLRRHLEAIGNAMPAERLPPKMRS